MEKSRLSRRAFLRWSALAGAGAAVAACATPTPQIIKETVVVEKEKVVTATPVAKQKVSIRYAFWGIPEEEAVNAQLKDAFEKINPNINVELSHGSGDWYALMLTQIGGGDPPDVMYLGEVGIAPFAAKKLLKDLKPYIQRDNLNLDDYWSVDVEPNIIDGKMFAFAKDTGPMVMYYNVDMFDEAGIPYPKIGWTWQEFVEAARRLTKKDAAGKIIQYGVIPQIWWAGWITTIYANGGSVLSPDAKKCVLTEPAAVEAMQALADLALVEPIVAPSPKAREDLGAGTTDLFTSGRGAMLVNGRWGAFFINVAKEKKNWRAVTYPMLKPGGNTAYTFVALSIPASAKHSDEAWEFIKFVVGPEGQRINAATGIGMPVRKDITQEPVWLVPGESKDSIEVFAKGMETARVLPFNPRWTEVIDDVAEKTLDPVWRGEITAAEGARQVCEKINPLLTGS